MADLFAAINFVAEQKIKQAMKAGEFDHLEGQGQPLKLEDDSFLPPEQRMAYKILKNSGFVAPEIAARKEVDNLVQALEKCRDEQQCYRKLNKLNYLVTKINANRPSPLNLEFNPKYYRKIVQKVELAKKTK